MYAHISTQKIQVNPEVAISTFAKGSARRKDFARIMRSATVGDYFAKGGTRNDLRFFRQRKYIKLIK